jgi:hypothetical protein
MQIDQNRQEWEARQKQLELQQEAQLEQIRKSFDAQLRDKDIALAQWKAAFDRETQIILKRIDASVTLKQHDDDMQMASVNAAREDMRAESEKEANDAD